MAGVKYCKSKRVGYIPRWYHTRGGKVEGGQGVKYYKSKWVGYIPT